MDLANLKTAIGQRIVGGRSAGGKQDDIQSLESRRYVIFAYLAENSFQKSGNNLLITHSVCFHYGKYGPYRKSPDIRNK